MEDEQINELRIEGRQFLHGPVWHRLFKVAIHIRIEEIRDLLATNKRLTIEQLREAQGALTVLQAMIDGPQVFFGLDEP